MKKIEEVEGVFFISESVFAKYENVSTDYSEKII